VPGLLAAQDVAGAADLEVGQRDLEARAQLGCVEDRLEPLRASSERWSRRR